MKGTSLGAKVVVARPSPSAVLSPGIGATLNPPEQELSHIPDRLGALGGLQEHPSFPKSPFCSDSSHEL